MISSQKPFFINSTITDEHGIYTFENLPPIDSGSFFIQAKTPKGNKMSFGELTVNRLKTPPIPERFLDQQLPWYVNADVAQLNYVKHTALKADEKSLRKTGIQLNEVKITDKKIIKNSFNRNGPGKADLVFDEQDIKESGVVDLYQLLKQKLPGLRVIMERGLPTIRLNRYMVVVEIDGGGLPVKLNPNPSAEELIEELSAFKIASFKGMEVLYSRKFMGNYQKVPSTADIIPAHVIAKSENDLMTGVGEFSSAEMEGRYYVPGYRGGYLEGRVNVLTNDSREIAVIVITTGSQRGWYKISKAGVNNYRPLPLMKPQEFYSPKYTGKAIEVAEPDYRSTIYWKPNVITDAAGKARITFYTSDLTGKYNVNLQGADLDGNIGGTNTNIKVVDVRALNQINR